MIEKISDLITAIANRIFGFFNGVIQAIFDVVNGIISWVRSLLVGAWDNYILPWITAIKDWAEHGIKSALDTALGHWGINDWLDSNKARIIDGASFVSDVNGIIPLVEIVWAFGFIVSMWIIGLQIKVIVKVIRG